MAAMGQDDASAARWEGRSAKRRNTAWTLDLGHSAFRCVKGPAGWLLEAKLPGKGWEPFGAFKETDPAKLLLAMVQKDQLQQLVRAGH